ncbi:50S ribosomal protein L10 [Candidatus Woesearchaeota archaeon CG10_big_fil_rev_8_21_14_0_10_34_8]|nr:MAG: 50S ribosomal protein L10 [Candidatus Woesearchaeota archaeon CG10_big_fil_rev_8_21_14_0_10_34_8]
MAAKISANRKEKEKTVDEFAKLLEEYPIVGVVNMMSLPTKQLQNMRAQLRQTVVLRMTKHRLIKRAIEKAKAKKQGIEQLEEYLKGMPALIFTKENPFTLYKTLGKNKSTAPAKAGQVAPKDIVVKAGGTSFAPGPIIGELGSLGIKAGIEGGKVSIKSDSVVAKEGDVISDKLAGILSRLGIEPMEIGLDLKAVYEDGNIFTSKVLAIDEDEYKNNIAQAAAWAMNLAVEAAYPTKETSICLIQKAFRQAKGVAVESGIMSKELAADILAKAHAQMSAVKNAANFN